MRRSRRCVNGERKTSAVCNCHELHAFAPLGLSHSEPPFLATTNIPSIKHSLRSRSPRARGSSARSWRQNASKKIDVAWQFPAAAIEYIGVVVKKTHLKHSNKSPCPPQAGRCQESSPAIMARLFSRKLRS